MCVATDVDFDDDNDLMECLESYLHSPEYHRTKTAKSSQIVPWVAFYCGVPLTEEWRSKNKARVKEVFRKVVTNLQKDSELSKPVFQLEGGEGDNDIPIEYEEQAREQRFNSEKYRTDDNWFVVNHDKNPKVWVTKQGMLLAELWKHNVSKHFIAYYEDDDTTEPIIIEFGTEMVVRSAVQTIHATAYFEVDHPGFDKTEFPNNDKTPIDRGILLRSRKPQATSSEGDQGPTCLDAKKKPAKQEIKIRDMLAFKVAEPSPEVTAIMNEYGACKDGDLAPFHQDNEDSLEVSTCICK